MEFFITKKTKEDIDKELSLYKREQQLAIDISLESRRAVLTEARMMYLREEADRKAELAKLDAMLDDKKKRIENLQLESNDRNVSHEKIVSALEKQVQNLNELVQFMATKLATVDLKSLGVTVVESKK